MEREVKVKSLYKALKILECFTEQEPELGITEISNELGLYKSNVHNIVTTFEKAGYIEKNLDNDKYRLGLKILELAHVMSSNISFRSAVLPYMQNIADQANEIVYFGIPNEGQVIYLDSAYPRNAIPSRSMLGRKAPMYCTAIGKAMLAYFHEDEILNILSSDAQQFTPNTIVTPEGLLQEMEKTRERGYSIDNMEHEHGIKCVGIALHNRRGQLIAGLSISGPSLRLTEDKIQDFAKLLKENANLIKERL